MAAINLSEWSQKKKRPLTKGLRGKSVLLYGVPKVGKTTFAAGAEKVLFFSFENGTNFVQLDTDPVPVNSWTEMKSYLKQLRSDEMREQFHTLVFDTVTIAQKLCEQFICQRENVKKIKDIPFGSGYGMPAAEFFDVFNELAMLGYGQIFIAHTKTQNSDFVDEHGDPIQQVAPDVDKRIFAVLNGLCDIIAYAAKEYDPVNKTMQRILYNDPDSPYMVSGGRNSEYFPKAIPLKYEIFAKKLDESIEMAAKSKGTQVQSFVTPPAIEKKSYGDVMHALENKWVEYLQQAASQEEHEQRIGQLTKKVEEIFGSNVNLSTVPPAQQDLLEALLIEIEAM